MQEMPVLAARTTQTPFSTARSTECAICWLSAAELPNHESLVTTASICAPFFTLSADRGGKIES